MWARGWSERFRQRQSERLELRFYSHHGNDWSLLNYFIRPRQHRRRDREAEGLRGLQVDHHLELGGLLDGQVGGRGAPEDPVHIGRGAPAYCFATIAANTRSGTPPR